MNDSGPLWDLVGRLLSGDAGALELAASVELFEAVPTSGLEFGERHVAAFEMDVWPWVSAWASAEGLRGGDVCGHLVELRSRWGLTGDEADDVGALCRTAAEMEAEPRGTFVRRFLSPWLPSLHSALALRGSVFQASLVEVALEMAVVEGPAEWSWGPTPQRWSHLLLPRRAGVFLSRARLCAIGSALEVPVSPGPRSVSFRDLVEGAGVRGRGGQLVAALRAELAGERAALEAWGRRGAKVAAATSALDASDAYLAAEAP